MVDYGSLPPEINSARMYAGAGSASLISAAASWDDLATDLRAEASSYSAIISGLSTDQWRGAASTSMASAATTYIAWMTSAAAQAEQTAGQARAAAAAYEAAYSMTVPPAVVADNRTQLASLIATNLLGQNTAAIAATEADYGEMWAQDSAAMYSYAGSSAVATQLTPFTGPQQNSNPSGLASQAEAVSQATTTSTGTSTQSTLSQIVSSVPSTLEGMASPASSAGSSASSKSTLASSSSSSSSSGSSSSSLLSELWSDWGPDANIWNTIFSSGFYMPSNWLGPFTGFMGQSQEAAGGAAAAAGDGVTASGVMTNVVGWSVPESSGDRVSAAVGRAVAIGPLSVPPAMTGGAPAATPVASASTAGPSGTAPAVASGMPGMPGMPITSVPANSVTSPPPKYGFRPTVIARPPAAG